MDSRHRATLRNVVETFAPLDARIERVTEHAAAAIDGLSPHRRAKIERLLDVLRLPMKGPYAARWALLRTLATAPVSELQTGFAALKRLSLFLAYGESEAGSENPTWARIGYPGPRDDAQATTLRLPLAEAAQGERIRADVVVVGSGAGGGVIAAAFARAGRRVVVLEAAGAFGPADFTQRELMMSQLYLDAGLTATSDLGIAILAGANVGGGTTVNWCTALRLPDRIADEWGDATGISSLTDDLRPHYDAAERRLDVRTITRHNANNRVILDGARALGIHAAPSARNASTQCGDGCGYCGFGCAYDNKRSTAATYLQDLCESGAIYANAPAIRIEMSEGRARGVLARQIAADGARTFTVEADFVVAAAGALRTPGLLARSGFAHPLLGKRLFLHPVAAAIAEFDRPIEPWNGPMQSAYSDAFNYRSGNYGAKIEVAPSHPGIAALAAPWLSRGRHSGFMERLGNACALFALTRDRDPGSIELTDEAEISYQLSAFDGENLLAGLSGIADLAFAAGAKRLTTLHTLPLEIEREEWSIRHRREFEQRLRSRGVAPNRQILFSAHQMGTAAMGSDPQRSVVDPCGRVWGFDNLLVADASVFPLSSGVNPMLTIMAMASRIAEMNGAL
jgi:choline dehydrogenase-like flavoprotein